MFSTTELNLFLVKMKMKENFKSKGSLMVIRYINQKKGRNVQ